MGMTVLCENNEQTVPYKRKLNKFFNVYLNNLWMISVWDGEKRNPVYGFHRIR